MSDKTFHGRKTLSGWIQRPLKKVQQKRGFAEGRLLTDWPSIVGPVLAQHCAPQKLSFPAGQSGATLHIICESGWATELQFQQEVLCDKIATFFGYRAVGAIRIHQGALPKKPAKPAGAPPADLENAPEKLKAEVSCVEDADLKEALLRFGLSLESARKLAMNEAKDNENGGSL